MDRQILAILIEPIKADLGLSDTHLGFLSGMAFAVFYVTMGIPLGRLADIASRRNIIVSCLSIWSLMTAFAGLAQNFTQLLMARIGVGVGEAGCVAPAQSMIADYFPPERRATALAVFSMGAHGGILVGFMLGGWINEAFGWRMAFLAVGLPGLLLALVMWLTVQEPERGRYDPKPAHSSSGISFAGTMTALWQKKTFIYIAIGGGLQSLVIYGTLTWMPSFLIRVHELETGEIGTYLALIQGILGAGGTFLGGYLADKMTLRNLRWHLWLPAVSALAAVPFSVGIYLAGTPIIALCFFAVTAFLGGIFIGPLYATILGIVPARMRATAVAIFLFIGNLIGLGLGPLAVGMISDALLNIYANDSIGYALLIVSLTNLLAGGLYLLGSRYICPDWVSGKVKNGHE